MRIQNENGILSIQIGGRWRKVGEIHHRILFVERDSIEHFMRKYNGYGFNFEILSDNRFADYIMLVETVELKPGILEKKEYLLDRQDMLTHGLIDQVENYEKQVFLSREKLDKLNQNNVN